MVKVKKSTKKITKTTAVKKTAKPASKSTAALRAISEKETRVEILRCIAEETGLTVKQVREVFLVARARAARHMMKRGSGEFSLPEMALKITRKTRPATKKRMGRNPKTGEAVMIPARPARQVIKVRVLKGLKEVIA